MTFHHRSIVNWEALLCVTDIHTNTQTDIASKSEGKLPTGLLNFV